MTAYVYMTYRPDTEEFYIGKRSLRAGVAVSDDVRYFGSNRWIKDQLDSGVLLKKEILAICDATEEANDKERKAISIMLWHPKCRNIAGTHAMIACECGKFQFTPHMPEHLYMAGTLDPSDSFSYSTWMFENREQDIPHVDWNYPECKNRRRAVNQDIYLNPKDHICGQCRNFDSLPRRQDGYGYCFNGKSPRMMTYTTLQACDQFDADIPTRKAAKLSRKAEKADSEFTLKDIYG